MEPWKGCLMSGTSEVGADSLSEQQEQGWLDRFTWLDGGLIFRPGEPGVLVLQQTKTSSTFPDSGWTGCLFHKCCVTQFTVQGEKTWTQASRVSSSPPLFVPRTQEAFWCIPELLHSPDLIARNSRLWSEKRKSNDHEVSPHTCQNGHHQKSTNN